MTSAQQQKQRRIWFDPRFAIGIALVVLSVVGVAGVVSAAAASSQVLAARQALVPGQHLTVDDFVATSVRAGAIDRLYLSRSDIPSGGVVVTRAIASGELVPRSAVGSVASTTLRSVVVPVSTALSASVQQGARVDLWSAAKDSGADDADGNTPATGGYDAPTVIVSSAIVVRVIDQKGLVQTGTGSDVELLVPSASTADVLDAVANAAALSVVPVDLPLGR